MSLHHARRGSGPPVLMIHGLGGSIASWDPIAAELAAQRELISVDLPGFGATPALPGPPSIAALADALEGFIDEQGLDGVDAVGSSLGARLALELARRGKVGAVVALDPGGFWAPGALRFFGISVNLSIRLVRGLQPLMGFLTGNPVTLTLLFLQFSARPWALSRETVLPEMRSFGSATAIYTTLHELVSGPVQAGASAESLRGPVVLGWGRQDRVTFPGQASTAQERFPSATVHWFERCGHFPHWDQPAETVQLILQSTAASAAAQ